MRRIARRLVAKLARRIGSLAEARIAIWRDRMGAGIMVRDEVGNERVFYFSVSEARDWGDTLLTAAYHHAEGFPIPLENANQ